MKILFLCFIFLFQVPFTYVEDSTEHDLDDRIYVRFEVDLFKYGDTIINPNYPEYLFLTTYKYEDYYTIKLLTDGIIECKIILESCFREGEIIEIYGRK